VDETDPSELEADENLGQGLVAGVKAAYSIPSSSAQEVDTNEVDTSGVSLDDLMAQMKAI
jgi:tRNA U34 5-carboxymethylaminomethyl modifying enzyme MnmG/GidA